MKPRSMRLRKVDHQKMPDDVTFIMVWHDPGTGGVWTDNVKKIDGVLHIYDHANNNGDNWTTDSPYLNNRPTHNHYYRRY